MTLYVDTSALLKRYVADDDSARATFAADLAAFAIVELDQQTSLPTRLIPQGSARLEHHDTRTPVPGLVEAVALMRTTAPLQAPGCR